LYWSKGSIKNLKILEWEGTGGSFKDFGTRTGGSLEN
jgi:hypothetical protein